MTSKEVKAMADVMPNISFVPAGFEYWKEELLRRIINIFTYDNLPDTCNQDVLRRQLFYGKLKNGCSIFAKADDGYIYNLDGTPCGTGPYTFYNVHPEFTLAVDSLRISVTKGVLGVNGEVVYNDSLKIGLHKIIDRYARMLADEDSTFSKVLYNMRRPNYFNAPDEKVAKSIKTAMDDNELGIDRVILGKDILSEASILANAPGAYGNGVLTEHIMTKNGIINQFMRELGIPCVDEKKERINEQEIDTQNSGLSIIHDMLNTQAKCFEKVNVLFDTNITVRVSDEWAWLFEDRNNEEETTEDVMEDPADDMADTGAESEDAAEPMEEVAEDETETPEEAEPEEGQTTEELIADGIVEIVEDAATAIEEALDIVPTEEENEEEENEEVEE